MKRLAQFTVAGFFLILTVNAYADSDQTECGPVPSKPSIPYAATAEKWMIEVAIENVKKYNRDMKKYIECMQERLRNYVNEANEVNKELSEAIKLMRQ